METSEIVEAVDAVEYISQFCELTEKNGEYWGLSPFKEEKTPSFSIRPNTGYWYDFSSGQGGNIVEFVKRYNRVSLYEAIEILKRYAGIKDEGDTSEGVINRTNASRIARRFKDIHDTRKCESHVSKLPSDTMSLYEFDENKLKLWADEGISYDTMRKFGVSYDPFSDRIVYPIKNYDGDIICVSGRTCDPDYKAKGIRKYTYFQSLGSIDTIYAYSDNKQSILNNKEIILFEGAKSVMLAHGWGIFNTGALLTSHLSRAQLKFLIKLSSWEGVRVVFALDSEVDITLDDNIKFLNRYARVEWVKNINGYLKDKDSPTDRGYGIFKKLYDRRRRLI